MLASKFDNLCPKFAKRTTNPKCQTMECLHFNWTTYGRILLKEQQGLDVEFTTYARSLPKETIKDIQKKIYYMVQYNYSFIINIYNDDIFSISLL